MEQWFNGSLLSVGVIVMVLVLFAMTIDLIAGIIKARTRGEARRSKALKRSLIKFITYEGGLLIAIMIDTLLYYVHIFEMLHLPVFVNVPVFTLLVGIFLLAVEFISVREKADEKTQHRQEELLQVFAGLFSKEEAKEIIEKLINRDRRDNAESERL